MGCLPATRGLTPGFKPQHSRQGGPVHPQPDLLAFPPRPPRSRVPTTFLLQPRTSRLSQTSPGLLFPRGPRPRLEEGRPRPGSARGPVTDVSTGHPILSPKSPVPWVRLSSLISKIWKVSHRGCKEVPCPHPLPKHPVHPRRGVWLTPLWGLPTCKGRLDWKLQWRGGRMRGLLGKQVREHHFALLGEGGGRVKR